MSQQRSATVTTLAITDSDPNGSAGTQAGMRAISALGSYAVSVITTLTVQSTRGVAGVHAVSVELIRLQVGTLLEDIVPDTTKIGMFTTTELVDVVEGHLPGSTHTVLDPVMVITSRGRPLNEQAVGAVRRLCVEVDLITSNLYEMIVLLGEEPAATLGELCNQAQRLRDLGACRVLVKGGHLSGDAGDAVNVCADADGVEILCSYGVSTQNTHGTGYMFFSAIASLRPRRTIWLETVWGTEDYLTGATIHVEALGVGYGRGPVYRFHRVWTRAG